MKINKHPCRSCGSPNLELILSLGCTPLANALLTEAQPAHPEEKFPLDLVFCPTCTLVQITETVPPEKLFREYLYFSSFSDTMLQHVRELAEEMTKLRQLDSESLVVELASNDGYLLQYYQQAGVPVLGVEPAVNIARVAWEERNIPTISEFFGTELACGLTAEGKRADVIHAHNVLAHVADLNDFVEGIHQLLKEDGVAVIEVPYVKDMIDRCEFDTIYHEHLCYFSLTALERLFRGHGLLAYDVKRVPLHGGSLCIYATQAHGRYNQAQPSIHNLLVEEADWGVTRLAFYEGFAHQVEDLRAALVGHLSKLKKQGKRLAAYGAAAKGSTLLNYFGIGRETLDFVVDRSTYKQGRYMPGVHLPIYSPDKLLEARPDYVLLLVWNFADEVLEQQQNYREAGGRFIIPLPTVKVL
jgi:SAM-dependent methyltransferase